tara:strand:- start:1057 stop:1905 length:849 start_codon:yes stop_codon:yes gene_type:complete
MNILTFDIEEWFHILDNDSTKTEINWENYEERIYKNMDKIFSLLEKHKLKATFFVVGWIANKYPDIIKKIDNYGHEIGSHTYLHQLMYEQKPKEINEDLKKSINTIQDIIGKKVYSFRAPGFSITEKNKWVFDLLIQNGITHDCSIFPAGRAHGGFPSYTDATPSKLNFKGSILKEFPINTASILGQKWIFSGGGYFRITPYNLIKKWTMENSYVMTYFHPRDFDPDQPIISELSLYRKFKSYVGLKNSLNKLHNWVSDFSFVDLSTADKNIDWSGVKEIKL